MSPCLINIWDIHGDRVGEFGTADLLYLGDELAELGKEQGVGGFEVHY